MATPTTKLTAVDYLFDRPINLRHPWRSSFTGMIADARNNIRAAATNLRMDWRVETHADEHLQEAPEFAADNLAHGLDFALGAYFLTHYCQPATAVAFMDSTEIRFPNHRKLIRVASLDAMIRRIWRNDNTRLALAQEIRLIFGEGILRPGLSEGDPNDRSIDALAIRLNQAGPEAIKTLISAIHDILGPQQPHWWGSFQTDVSEHLSNGRDLADALGLGEFSEGEWLVIYTYTIADAGLLFRPTAIEANRYPFHFVSPPDLQTGLTMPLNLAVPAVSEVIHYPLAPDAAAQACTGKLQRIGTDREMPQEADAERYAELRAMRAAQRQRIYKRWSQQSSRKWLERHKAAF